MKSRTKILFVGGSINQTKMVVEVARHLQDEYDCYFSPAFADGALDWARRAGLLEFTVAGHKLRKRAETYLLQQQLPIDYGGREREYDLFVITSDLVVPKKARNKPVILIQEGMTDPEDFRFWLVKWLKLPRWLAGTAANGLSDAYRYFCVASEGYRELFVRKGCRPEKVVVTSIPNFDNVQSYCQNDFPHRDYVLVATSNTRETFKLDDRKQFLTWALNIAGERPLIFKLHPAEDVARSTAEILSLAPHALVYADGNTDHMIANSSVLITQYSTCVYVGLALGKECYSYLPLDELKRLTPLQTGGAAGSRIAQVCRQAIEEAAQPRPVARPSAQPALRKAAGKLRLMPWQPE